jgi:hypothetical protein
MFLLSQSRQWRERVQAEAERELTALPIVWLKRERSSKKLSV